MPFDSSRVPNEIWFKIAQFSDLKEAMHLETTCKFLRGVISNKTFWLERLHALDQDRAPNLPRHVRLNELDFSDLRILVERAHRRRFNCTAPTLLRPTRKITVPIRPEDSDDPCGGPYGFGRGDVALLPGGALLLVLWSSGYLQCWDVQGGERVWVYPQRASSDVLDMQMPKVCEFSYDMQADGNVHVLVVSESTDNRTSERTLEILQFSPPRKAPRKLYECKPEHLDEANGALIYLKLSGDVSATYTEGYLVLTFWKEERSIVILCDALSNIDLVDDYLICMLDNDVSENEAIIVAMSLSSIHDILLSTATRRTTPVLTLDDVPYASCLIQLPPHLICLGAKLSVCTFHWKTEAERKRKGIVINVLKDVLSEETSCDFPLIDSFLLETADVPESETFLPNNDLPRITHLGHPGSSPLDQQPNTYSMVPFSQAGSTVIVFCDEALERKDIWTLATICDKEIVFRMLDVPRGVTLGMEFYSGALYFPTIDAASIVIQYFD